MPAVLRPALTSVTRRTLTSVLARERSINFCRFRTLAQVSCLRCREDPLPQTPYVVLDLRQSMDGQSVISSSGPFTTPAAVAAAPWPQPCRGVQLALRFQCCSVIVSSQAHPAHVSTLSGRGIGPYPASYAGTSGGGAGYGVPVSCCLSATGIRFWVFLHPPEDRPSSRSAYQARTALPGLHRGCHVPHETDADRGGCPLHPGDGGALPPGQVRPVGTCRFPTASPYLPLEQPIGESDDDEASTRVHRDSPVRSFPACNPRMERGSLGISSGFAPRITRNARRGGDESLHTGRALHLRHHAEPPSVSATASQATSCRTTWLSQEEQVG